MSNPHGHEPKVGTGQGTGTQRGVRSTRTPATRTAREPEHQHAHRSQTLLTPAPVSTTRRTPTPQMTMPAPTTTTSSRQRTPSFPKTQPKKSPSPVPEPSKPKTSLDGTGYIVEPLQPTFRSESREGREPQTHLPSPMSIPTSQPTFRSESREGRKEPQTHLPPPRSIPIPKPTLDSTRQSVSSFQTEPSSYYSAAEDAGSTGGTPIPPPQIPQPSHTEPETQLSRYEALWLAAQADEAPPMPVPEVAPPPIPSAHVDFEPSSYNYRENEADFEDEYQEEADQSGTDEYEQHVDTRGQEDRPQFFWSGRPPPGMPVPTSGHSRTSSASNPPIPVPSSGRDYDAQPTHGSTPFNHPQASQGTTPESRPIGTISTTAPLRIHHSHRPSAVGPPSPGLPPPRPSLVPSPTSQYTSQSQPIPPRINSQQQQQNTPAGSGFNVTSRPPNERPSGTSNTFSPSQPHHKTGSSYEERPPGASAPSIPSGTNTSIYHNPPGKQYTGQSNTVRPSKTQVTGGPTSTSPTSSSFSPPSQPAVSTHATTTAPSLSSTPPFKPTPPSSSATPSYTNTKPTVSSNLAPQRPHATVSNAQTQPSTATATTTARPPAQVLESTRPTISAPQIQHQSSTGSSAPSKPQVKIQEHSPAPAPAPVQHAAAPSRPTRSHFGQSLSQMDTQYVNMLLALDDIPFLHNLLAGFFNWILLAGFILFPGTFTSLQNLNASGVTAQVQHQLVNAVTHIPLFVIAWVCTGVGAIGMIWMSWKWRKNYLWGLNKIFMPGFLNSLAGLLSTLANIFGVQHGQLSTTSKITLIVTSASTGVLGILTAFYTLWLVRRVKKRHDDEVGKERAGKHGEGVVNASKRKANGGR